MRLHFAPRTRAARVRWLLEELEVPYELVREEARASSTHPSGDVPRLVDGEVTLFEASAMCLHLVERFPERGMAPRVGSPQRAEFLQWLLFAELRVEPRVLELRANPDLSREPLQSALAVIDDRLSTREFLAGDVFSAADLVTASILHLAHASGLLEAWPRLGDYVKRLTFRPASRRAVS